MKASEELAEFIKNELLVIMVNRYHLPIGVQLDLMTSIDLSIERFKSRIDP